MEEFMPKIETCSLLVTTAMIASTGTSKQSLIIKRNKILRKYPTNYERKRIIRKKRSKEGESDDVDTKKPKCLVEIEMPILKTLQQGRKVRE